MLAHDGVFMPDQRHNTARSSSSPILPSTTHALRLSIHNFARLIAEPLNAAA